MCVAVIILTVIASFVTRADVTLVVRVLHYTLCPINDLEASKLNVGFHLHSPGRVCTLNHLTTPIHSPNAIVSYICRSQVRTIFSSSHTPCKCHCQTNNKNISRPHYSLLHFYFVQCSFIPFLQDVPNFKNPLLLLPLPRCHGRNPYLHNVHNHNLYAHN